VDGLEKQYRSCLKVERTSFHTNTHWSELIGPIGAPEFALLDAGETILHRWVGFTEEEEFIAVLEPLCKG
jgi:hypothetical protein